MKTCTVVLDGVGCDKPHRAKGLCSGHYRQRAMGYEFTKLRTKAPRGSLAIRDAKGNKHCARCDQWLDESQFARSSSSSDGFQSWCRRCQQDERKQTRYGFDQTAFEALVDAQDGKCRICAREYVAGKTWHVDHDHACCMGVTTCGNCIRGVLCNRCNQMLGLAGDSVQTLQSAIEYLGGKSVK